MFRYETHLHTNIVSACSGFSPEEIVARYRKLGYQGVFVTDHFLNGNTTVPQNLPWKERVARFCDGYRAVKACAKGALDVFFGLEYSYKGTDFLVYGLNEEWLFDHYEIMRMPPNEFCLFARGEGGLVVQAHPMREDFYIDHIRLFPHVVDGFETVNACRDDKTNLLADQFASVYGLIKTGGSDIHCAVQTHLAGMEFEEKLTDEHDYAARLRRGEGRIFILDDKETL